MVEDLPKTPNTQPCPQMRFKLGTIHLRWVIPKLICIATGSHITLVLVNSGQPILSKSMDK
jgi:hypothetical protein